MAFLYDHISIICESVLGRVGGSNGTSWWTDDWTWISWRLGSVASTVGSLARRIGIGRRWTRWNVMHLGRRLHGSCWWMIGGWRWQVIYNFFVAATVVIKFEEFADFKEKAPLTAGVIFPITERHHHRIWREQVVSAWTAESVSSDRQGNSCLPFNEDKISMAVTLVDHVYSNKAFYRTGPPGNWAAHFQVMCIHTQLTPFLQPVVCNFVWTKFSIDRLSAMDLCGKRVRLFIERLCRLCRLILFAHSSFSVALCRRMCLTAFLRTVL